MLLLKNRSYRLEKRNRSRIAWSIQKREAARHWHWHWLRFSAFFLPWGVTPPPKRETIEKSKTNGNANANACLLLFFPMLQAMLLLFFEPVASIS